MGDGWRCNLHRSTGAELQFARFFLLSLILNRVRWKLPDHAVDLWTRALSERDPLFPHLHSTVNWHRLKSACAEVSQLFQTGVRSTCAPRNPDPGRLPCLFKFCIRHAEEVRRLASCNDLDVFAAQKPFLKSSNYPRGSGLH